MSEWARNFYTRFDSVAVNGVRLQEYGCWEARGNWLYVFDRSPVIDGNKLYGGAYMAAVTMSGRVIGPREISE